MFYWWRQRRKLKRNPISVIRQELAFWGIGTTHLSDDELTDTIMKYAGVLRRSGISATQCAEGFKKMSIQEKTAPDR